MLGRNYFTLQATTLLKIARATSDPTIVTALVTKAIDLKSHRDSVVPLPDHSLLAPDVEGPLDL